MNKFWFFSFFILFFFFNDPGNAKLTTHGGRQASSPNADFALLAFSSGCSGWSQSLKLLHLIKEAPVVLEIEEVKRQHAELVGALCSVTLRCCSSSQLNCTNGIFLGPPCYRYASREESDSRFKGRVAIISFLAFILYPFLWAWTVIGSLCFTEAKTCSHLVDLMIEDVCSVYANFSRLWFISRFAKKKVMVQVLTLLNLVIPNMRLQLPEEGQKWGFLIWLIFSYCGLICVACISAGKVLFELIRIPNWAFLSVASGQENNIGQGGHDIQQGLYGLLPEKCHGLNLAVEAYIDRYLESEVDLVRNLMSKLSTLKEVGRLRMTSSLRPVKRNKTRWLEVIKMINRYEWLRSHIDDTNPDVAELLPTAGQRNVILHHTAALSDFKSVTESLQRENDTIWESQTLFQSPDTPLYRIEGVLI
ncbi:hypothetical protein AXG93_3857s1350 [Marchantia polymorpha subsp. ruderalis]|uniref:Uncharacterized protein n=1 Tax=Marchantia polymorpha subsp. ruderalis TaxID=1480154 RepID=A0A176W3B8_MARPO|nr:hypothetical protein AXG93_3857s1350 [Marchantia polymorpha subsp. ruderalis]